MTGEPILNEKQEQVRRMYFDEGRSAQEIADALGCTYRTAKRGVDELRVIFRSFGRELPMFNLGQRETVTAKAGKNRGDAMRKPLLILLLLLAAVAGCKSSGEKQEKRDAQREAKQI